MNTRKLNRNAEEKNERNRNQQKNSITRKE